MSKNPDPAQPALKYPYNWGRIVIQKFVESYPRGWYNFCRLRDIAPGNMRVLVTLALCRGNSVRFESIKRAIKVLEDYDGESLSRFSLKEKRLLYRWIVYLCEEDELDAREAREGLDIIRNRPLF